MKQVETNVNASFRLQRSQNPYPHHPQQRNKTKPNKVHPANSMTAHVISDGETGNRTENDKVEMEAKKVQGTQQSHLFSPSSTQPDMSPPVHLSLPPSDSPATVSASAPEEEFRDAEEPLLEPGSGSRNLPPDVNQPETEKEEEEEEDDGVPYDRGWAWMVVLGLFINFFLISGFIKSSGLIFVELLREFQAPATQTALLFAVRSGVFSFSALCVMNVLLGKFGSRKLVVTGSVLMCLSAILSSFATSLTVLICLHSVLLGMALAMVVSPAEVLVGRYFKKRRSLALGLAKCGASLANMAVPPLLTFLLSEYGLRGTLLLYGGVCLHSLPAAMLHRPTSFFSKRHRRRQRQAGNKHAAEHGARDDTKDAERPCGDHPGSCVTERTCAHNSDRIHINHSKSCGTVPMNVNRSKHVGKSFAAAETMAPGKPIPNRRHDDKNGSHHLRYLRSTSQEMPGPEIVSIEECDVVTLAKSHPGFGMLSTSIASPSLRKRTVSDKAEGGCRTTESPALRAGSGLLQAISQSSMVRYMSVSSLDGVSSTFAPPPFNLDLTRHADHFHDGDSNSRDGSQDACSCNQGLKSLLRCPRDLVLTLDFSLFRKPLFLLLMVYIVFYSFLNMILDYLPAMATEHGVSESRSALLLSIVGGLDLLCRLACGFLANLGVVRVSTMIAASFLVLGVANQFVRFMTTFQHFVVLAVLHGVFGAVANCMFAVLVIDFLGLDNMGKGLGFALVTCGVTMAAAYPLMGYIRDLTGSYAMSYHVIGVCLLVAAALVSAEGPVRRFQERRQRQMENEVP